MKDLDTYNTVVHRSLEGGEGGRRAGEGGGEGEGGEGEGREGGGGGLEDNNCK